MADVVPALDVLDATVDDQPDVVADDGTLPDVLDDAMDVRDVGPEADVQDVPDAPDTGPMDGGCTLPGDMDCDGIPDTRDPCPTVRNPLIVDEDLSRGLPMAAGVWTQCGSGWSAASTAAGTGVAGSGALIYMPTGTFPRGVLVSARVALRDGADAYKAYVFAGARACGGGNPDDFLGCRISFAASTQVDALDLLRWGMTQMNHPTALAPSVPAEGAAWDLWLDARSAPASPTASAICGVNDRSLSARDVSALSGSGLGVGGTMSAVFLSLRAWDLAACP